MNNLVLAYGSLRHGHYNNNGRNLKLVQKNVIVKGYKLYSFGAYPGAVYTGNNDDTIVCDLFDINSNQESYAIDRMEMGAGYHVRTLPIMIEGNETLHSAKIYEYIRGVDEKWLVKSGDWNNVVKPRESVEEENEIFSEVS